MGADYRSVGSGRACRMNAMLDLVAARSVPPAKDMAWIPGGTFRMGSDAFYPEERPVHTRVGRRLLDGRPPGDGRRVPAVREGDRPRHRWRSGRPTPPTTPTPIRRCSSRARSCSSRPAARSTSTTTGTGGTGSRERDWRHPEGPDSTLDGRERHPGHPRRLRRRRGVRRVGRQGAADRGRVGVRGPRRARRRDLRLGRRVRPEGPA